MKATMTLYAKQNRVAFMFSQTAMEKSDRAEHGSKPREHTDLHQNKMSIFCFCYSSTFIICLELGRIARAQVAG